MFAIKEIGAVGALLLLVATAPGKAAAPDYRFEFSGPSFTGTGDLFVNSAKTPLPTTLLMFMAGLVGSWFVPRRWNKGIAY